jgi:hypothetical protein
MTDYGTEEGHRGRGTPGTSPGGRTNSVVLSISRGARMIVFHLNSRMQIVVESNRFQHFVWFSVRTARTFDKLAKKIGDLSGKSAASLQRIWNQGRLFGRGLKLAWVSVASVAIGLLLFRFTPQAQDLFLASIARRYDRAGAALARTHLGNAACTISHRSRRSSRTSDFITPGGSP